MLSPEQLAAIRARCDAAHGAPWEVVGPAHRYDDDYEYQFAIYGPGYRLGDVGDRTTASFIAHAREDVPALLAEVERLSEDRYDKAQALAAVSTLIISNQGVPAEWNRYGAVVDARLLKRDFESASKAAYAAAAERDVLKIEITRAAADLRHHVRHGTSFDHVIARLERLTTPGATE